MTLREMCERFGVNYDNKHPERTRKNLSKMCEYVKNGRDYIVVREYNDIEKFMANSTKFSDYMTNLVVKELSISQKNRYTFSEMFVKMGMVNQSYITSKNKLYSDNPKDIENEVKKFTYKIEDAENDYGITEYNVVEINLKKFFGHSTKLLKEIIKNSLDSMQKKRYIFWKQTYRMYRKTEDGVVEYKDCTIDEAGHILHWENEALGLVGYSNKWFGNDKEAKEKFSNYVNTKIKQNYGYTWYVEAMDLTLAQGTIDSVAKQIDCEILLNQNVQNKLTDSKEMGDIIKNLNEQFVKEYINIEKTLDIEQTGKEME